MRSSSEQYLNSTGLVDKKIGELYLLLETIQTNLTEIRHISHHLPQLHEIYTNITDLLRLSTEDEALNFTNDNIGALSDYFNNLNTLITNRASLDALADEIEDNAELAQAWSSAAEDTEVITGFYSAMHHAIKAAALRDQAQQIINNGSTSIATQITDGNTLLNTTATDTLAAMELKRLDAELSAQAALNYLNSLPDTAFVKASDYGDFDTEDHATIINLATATGNNVALPDRTDIVINSPILQYTNAQVIKGVGKQRTVLTIESDLGVDFYGGNNNAGSGPLGEVDDMIFANMTIRQVNKNPERSFTDADVDLVTNTITTQQDHGFVTGDPITFYAADPDESPARVIRQQESGFPQEDATNAERLVWGNTYYAIVDPNFPDQFKIGYYTNGGSGNPSALTELDIDADGSTGTYLVRKQKVMININSTQHWLISNIEFVDCDLPLRIGRIAYFSQASATKLRGCHYGIINDCRFHGDIDSYFMIEKGANDIKVRDGAAQDAKLAFRGEGSGLYLEKISIEGVNYGQHLAIINGNSAHFECRLEAGSALTGVTAQIFMDLHAEWCSISGHSGTSVQQSVSNHPLWAGALTIEAGNSGMKLYNKPVNVYRTSEGQTAIAVSDEIDGSPTLILTAGGEIQTYDNSTQTLLGTIGRNANGHFKVTGKNWIIENNLQVDGTSLLSGAVTVEDSLNSSGNGLFLDHTGAITLKSYSQAELEDATSEANTVNKSSRKFVINSTTGKLVKAGGGSVNASWFEYDHNTVITVT